MTNSIQWKILREIMETEVIIFLYRANSVLQSNHTIEGEACWWGGGGSGEDVTYIVYNKNFKVCLQSWTKVIGTPM